MSTVRKFTMFGLLSLPLAVIAATVVGLAWGHSNTKPAEALIPGIELEIKPGDGTWFEKKSLFNWNIGIGSLFKVNAKLTKITFDGYIGVITEVDVDGLTYNQEPGITDELVWPDAGGLLARSVAGSVINHSGATASDPPFPISSFTGTVLELNLACTAGESSHTIDLVPWSAGNTDGTALVDSNDNVISLSHSYQIDCVIPPLGGVAELPDADVAPLAAGDASGPGFALIGAVAGMVSVGVGALVGAGWALRRRIRRLN